MPDWKKRLTHLVADAEAHFDRMKARLGDRLGDDDPLHILPFRDYGTAAQLRLRGRVLEHAGHYTAKDDDTVWDNLLTAYRRFESDEVPGARLRASCGGVSQEVTTDEEGYFEVLLEPAEPATTGTWNEVSLTLLAPYNAAHPAAEAIGRVIVPSAEAQFGIISDIDDTILQTNATNLLRMAQLTFLSNAHARMPFEGVAAFYRALVHGMAENPVNPIFYVSSSPWNLYDLLIDFMQLNQIPAGPLLLRDLGIDRTKFIKASHHDHKRAQIDRVLRTYPDLPFILIGDSGQEDTAIYLDVIRDFPGRILAAYIRDVSDDLRDVELKTLIAAAPRENVEVVFASDSFMAAEHAADKGYIPAETLGPILEEKTKDEQRPGPVEQLLTPDHNETSPS